MHSAEKEVQTVSMTSSCTQTEPEDQAAEQLFQTDHNAPGLKDFLHRVQEKVIRELVRNSKSHAFDGFQVNWDDRSQLVSTTSGSGRGGHLIFRERETRE